MEQKADHRGGGKGRRQRGGQIKGKSIGIVKKSFGADHRGGGKARRQRGGQIKSKSIGIVKKSFGAEG